MDAAEAVEVQYEELPFVLHSEDAMRPGAPAVWDEVLPPVPDAIWRSNLDLVVEHVRHGSWSDASR